MTQSNDMRSSDMTQSNDMRSNGMTQSNDMRSNGMTQSNDMRSNGMTQSNDMRSNGMTQSNDMRLPLSKNGVPIGLPEERRLHIENEHPDIHYHASEIFQTVSEPDFIQEGDSGALMAIRMSATFNGKYVVVVYRETEQTDGFIITAYFTRTPSNRRRVLWASSPSPQSENP